MSRFKVHTRRGWPMLPASLQWTITTWSKSCFHPLSKFSTKAQLVWPLSICVFELLACTTRRSLSTVYLSTTPRTLIPTTVSNNTSNLLSNSPTTSQYLPTRNLIFFHLSLNYILTIRSVCIDKRPALDETAPTSILGKTRLNRPMATSRMALQVKRHADPLHQRTNTLSR